MEGDEMWRVMGGQVCSEIAVLWRGYHWDPVKTEKVLRQRECHWER